MWRMHVQGVSVPMNVMQVVLGQPLRPLPLLGDPGPQISGIYTQAAFSDALAQPTMSLGPEPSAPSGLLSTQPLATIAETVQQPRLSRITTGRHMLTDTNLAKPQSALQTRKSQGLSVGFQERDSTNKPAGRRHTKNLEEILAGEDSGSPVASSPSFRKSVDAARPSSRSSASKKRTGSASPASPGLRRDPGLKRRQSNVSNHTSRTSRSLLHVLSKGFESLSMRASLRSLGASSFTSVTRARSKNPSMTSQFAPSVFSTQGDGLSDRWTRSSHPRPRTFSNSGALSPLSTVPSRTVLESQGSVRGTGGHSSFWWTTYRVSRGGGVERSAASHLSGVLGPLGPTMSDQEMEETDEGPEEATFNGVALD